MMYDMTRYDEIMGGEPARSRHLVGSLPTSYHQASDKLSAASRLMLISLLLVAMLTGGAAGAWGQSATLPNGDGYYYLINKGKDTNKVWYLKPATIEYEEGMPYLTTNTTGQVPGSLWIVKSNGGYHQIIHAEDMKYVTIHDPKSFGKDYNINRARMHLETITTPGDNNDFVFVENGSQYNIKHKTLVANVSGKNHIWWNPANDNNTLDNGGDKGWQYLIGLYNENTGGSVWELTFVKKCVTPGFTYDPVSDEISISSITSGAEIHYTTDGTDPDGSSPVYSAPFSATGVSKVKAIAYKTDFADSEIGTQIVKPATPVIDQTNCDNSLSISCETEGTVIYYTTDNTTPSTSSTLYNRPFIPTSGETVRAIAYLENALIPCSDEFTLNYTPAFTADKPTITVTVTGSGSNVEITGSGTIYYTTNEDDPEPVESQRYTDSFTIPDGSGTVTIKAIAKDGSLNPSCVARKKVYAFFEISDLSGLQSIADNPDRAYRLTADIENGSSFDEDITFSGFFDGGFHTIKGLNRPLFSKLVDEGTVKNVILDNVTVSNSSHAGAISNEAEGSARIYNCGVLSKAGNSSITSTGGYAGGIVGKISGDTRVVNCYNYASVTGGTYAGGIVGRNVGVWSGSTLVSSPRVALCMMYGDLSGGSEEYGRSPVYAGDHVSNIQNFTEYNYWRSKANVTYKKYNDQMAIDKDDYLTRFPFYRHILNTHRELAAYFLFAANTTAGSVGDITSEQVAEIGHWVLDKSKAPYPIIEEWKTNTKKVIDAPAGATVNVGDDNHSITSLSVTIDIDGSQYTASLPITDMDEANYDYTWGKVVLPFANEFKVNSDYTRICTGWKITSITGGNGATFEKYNFADRNCTNKDLYEKSGYIFAQGGNYIVPYGVTAITIEANFATAYYLSDPAYDIGLKSDYTGATNLGGTVPATYHGQTVATNLKTLLGTMPTAANPHVQAIVLVGNYHFNDGDLGNYEKAFTLMSIDADNNQEPDYGFYAYNSTDRPGAPSMRFDFLPVIPVGMAAHVNGSTGFPGVPIWKVRGWFEMTETCVFYTSQCEIDSGNFNSTDNGNGNNRWIVNSGYFVQIVRSRKTNCSKVSYIQMGGNVFVEEFYPGSHSDNGMTTTIVPVNVTGGEIKECFMTGYSSQNNVKAQGDNIYFWCAGGKIHKFLGAYVETPTPKTSGAKVNMTAKIDHAIIGRYFGGGTSAKASIGGNITTTITNSKVDFFCGGPEFSSATEAPVVVTNATNTIFGEYYGAGYGGTSITYARVDQQNSVDISSDKTYPISFGNVYKRLDKTSDGIGTCYKFEYIYHSYDRVAVARSYTGYAQFSLATTGNVTNNLTGCQVSKLTAGNTLSGEGTTGDFYGAGCQGKVSGTVNSTLTSCEVEGSAYGGGYKAESNAVKVYTSTAPSYSVYKKEMAIFTDFGEFPAPETFTWIAGTGDPNDTAKTLCTGMTQDEMNELGNVTGNISITIDGGSVAHDVFGGGNESKSLNNATVTLSGNLSVGGNVYGGGNKANVSGNATVNIQE